MVLVRMVWITSLFIFSFCNMMMGVPCVATLKFFGGFIFFSFVVRLYFFRLGAFVGESATRTSAVVIFFVLFLFLLAVLPCATETAAF